MCIFTSHQKYSNQQVTARVMLISGLLDWQNAGMNSAVDVWVIVAGESLNNTDFDGYHVRSCDSFSLNSVDLSCLR